MKILITGINGFLGSALAKRLISEGHQVIGVGRTATPPPLEGLYRYQVCDLTSAKETFNLFISYEPINRVYHFAGDIGGNVFLQMNPQALSNNTAMTANVMHAACVTHTNRVLFPSSVNIYDPDSSYGSERKVSEFLCEVAAHGSASTEIRIVRLANITGPGCPWKNGRERVVAALCRKIIRQEEIILTNSGEQLRSLLHIDDAIEALTAVLEKPSFRSGNAVNLGHHQLITVNEILTCIESISGQKATVTHVFTQPEKFPLSPAHFMLGQRNAGWKPTRTPQEAISDTFAWITSQMKLDKPHDISKK